MNILKSKKNIYIIFLFFLFFIKVGAVEKDKESSHPWKFFPTELKFGEKKFFRDSSNITNYKDNYRIEPDKDFINFDKAFTIANKLKEKIIKSNKIENNFVLFEAIEPQDIDRYHRSYFIKGDYFIFEWKPILNDYIMRDNHLKIQLNRKGNLVEWKYYYYEFQIKNSIKLSSEEAQKRFIDYFLAQNFIISIDKIVNNNLFIIVPNLFIDENNIFYERWFYSGIYPLPDRKMPSIFNEYRYAYLIEAEVYGIFQERKKENNTIIYAIDAENGDIIGKYMSQNDRILVSGYY